MRIGVMIDGILRNTLSKLSSTYSKYKEQEVAISSYDIANVGLDFENVEELIDFVFEEHALEIWGHATEMQHGAVNHFNKLVGDYREKKDEIFLISREFGKAIPSTFFFLAKTGCIAPKVIFVQSYPEIWTHADYLLTDNITLINDETRDKILLIRSPYSGDAGADFLTLQEINHTEIIE